MTVFSPKTWPTWKHKSITGKLNDCEVSWTLVSHQVGLQDKGSPESVDVKTMCNANAENYMRIRLAKVQINMLYKTICKEEKNRCLNLGPRTFTTHVHSLKQNPGKCSFHKEYSILPNHHYLPFFNIKLLILGWPICLEFLILQQALAVIWRLFACQILIFDDQMYPAQDRLVEIDHPIRCQEKDALEILEFSENNGHKTIMGIMVRFALLQHRSVWQS